MRTGDVTRYYAGLGAVVDVEAGTTTAATAGVMAACTGASLGIGTVGCGVLASALGPVLGKYGAKVLGDGWKAFGYGLEWAGIKDKPEFSDIAVPMWKNAVNALNEVRSAYVKAITSTIKQHRASIGLKSTTMVVPPTAWDGTGLGMGGKALPIEDVARYMLDYLLALAWMGAWGLHPVQCGWVKLVEWEHDASNIAIPVIESGAVLQPAWSINCDSVFHRQSAFEQGAKVLSVQYANMMSNLEGLVPSAVKGMLLYESVNPETVAAIKANVMAQAQAKAKQAASAAASAKAAQSKNDSQKIVLALLATGVALGVGAAFALKRKH